MPEQRLDLAGAILDGARIDWAAVESTSDAAEWELLSRLKILETVAEFHRRAPWLPSADEGPLATLRARPPAGAEPWPEAWGHLRLLDRIGEGGFGQVYRAWDPWLDREVALKLLPAARCRMSGTESSVIHEGRLLARVAMLDESRTLARSMGSKALEAGANHALAQSYGQRGALGPVRELAATALVLYREAGRSDGIASTLTTLGLAHLNAGDPIAARRTLEEAAAIPLSVTPEDQVVAARLALARAVVALEESRWEDARTLALRAASVFRAERLRDDEASAHEVMALIALASRNLSDAQSEIAQAEKLLVGQDFLCRMSVGITAARVLAATKRPQDLAAAHRTLLDLRNRASGLQYVLLEYEVRLALHEVELALAPARPGPLGPAEFEAEARKMGQALLARKVAAAVAGKPSVSGIRSLGLMVR